MSNSKKVIVITGASQGLGAGMVKAFRDLDYKVVATSRSIKPSTDPDILTCLLYTSPSPRDRTRSRMPSSA